MLRFCVHRHKYFQPVPARTHEAKRGIGNFTNRGKRSFQRLGRKVVKIQTHKTAVRFKSLLFPFMECARRRKGRQLPLSLPRLLLFALGRKKADFFYHCLLVRAENNIFAYIPKRAVFYRNKISKYGNVSHLLGRFKSEKRRIQVTNATFRSWFINWLKTWFGVSKLSLFLGLLFSSFSTKLIYSSVTVSKFVFLGIYWRTKPLRFSFAPLSQLW